MLSPTSSYAQKDCYYVNRVISAGCSSVLNIKTLTIYKHNLKSNETTNIVVSPGPIYNGLAIDRLHSRVCWSAHRGYSGKYIFQEV